MIAFLNGTVAAVLPPQTAYIDVAGVGYAVAMPGGDLGKLAVGATARVLTYLSVTENGIALFGFLIPVTGIGDLTAVVALTVYALLPMVRNTYTGISNIDLAILEAAKGMGSTRFQVLWKIKLPLAMPVIMSGIRSMVTMTIALAGIASFIGAGGLGVAIAYPQAKALHEAGCEVDLIVGFRNEHLIILKDELAAACTDLTIMTDDGSNANKGFVTQALQAKLDAGKVYDEVIAIGPLPMMKAVCDLTKPKDIKTIVSMNPIMIDGTGMCGGCRVTVGGVTKFACVDGPDFDGHQVDWAEAISRSRMFRPEEQRAMEKLHKCRLTGGVR